MVQFAKDPYDIDELLRQLSGAVGSTPATSPSAGPAPSAAYDPYAATQTTPSASGGAATQNYLNRYGQGDESQDRDSGDPQGGGGTYTDGNFIPDNDGGTEQAPGTTVKNKTCPAGYEWEDGGPSYPNGRCKVAGTNWDDGCWIDTDGRVYCNDNPKPRSSEGGGGDQGGATQTQTQSVGRGATNPSSYTFNLQSLMDMLGPQYAALIAQIQGRGLPYDDPAVERLVSQRKVASEQQKIAQSRQLQAQRSASGMGMQGATQQDLRQIGAQADQAADTDINAVRENAIKANYAAKLQQVDQQIQALNSHANFVLGLASSDTARNSAQLQYSAQLNALQQQRSNLEYQLAEEMKRLKLQVGAGLL